MNHLPLEILLWHALSKLSHEPLLKDKYCYDYLNSLSDQRDNVCIKVFFLTLLIIYIQVYGEREPLLNFLMYVVYKKLACSIYLQPSQTNILPRNARLCTSTSAFIRSRRQHQLNKKNRDQPGFSLNALVFPWSQSKEVTARAGQVRQLKPRRVNQHDWSMYHINTNAMLQLFHRNCLCALSMTLGLPLTQSMIWYRKHGIWWLKKWRMLNAPSLFHGHWVLIRTGSTAGGKLLLTWLWRAYKNILQSLEMWVIFLCNFKRLKGLKAQQNNLTPDISIILLSHSKLF